MKIIARAFLLVFMLGCGGDDDDSCTPGSGAAAGASCSKDSDCQSCDCMVYEGEGGFCIGSSET